jgi:hypothetical protein
MEYHDFELSIGAHDGDGFPIFLTRAPVGSGAQGRFRLEANADRLERQLDELELAVLKSRSNLRVAVADSAVRDVPRDFGRLGLIDCSRRKSCARRWRVAGIWQTVRKRGCGFVSGSRRRNWRRCRGSSSSTPKWANSPRCRDGRRSSVIWKRAGR